MNVRICGTGSFIDYSDKNGQRFYIENTKTRTVTEIRLGDWTEFSVIVEMMSKHIDRVSGVSCQR